MQKKTNFNINFTNDKEIFNNKIYPIGTAFCNLINAFSRFAYNDKLRIETYPNLEFKIASLEIIRTSLIDLIYNSFPDIDIEGILIEENDFRELKLFTLKLDEFFQIIKKLNLQKLNRLELNSCFRYFFSNMKDCPIPNYSIKNIDETTFINEQKNIYNSDISDKDKVNKIYDSILKDDMRILEILLNGNVLEYQYHCNNFIDVILASLSYIIEKDVNVKQCEFCHQFFIPTHDNKKFCDKIRPQYNEEDDEHYNSTKYTCNEYNKKYLSYKNMSEEKQAIRRVTQNIQQRIRRGTETEEYLRIWQKKVDDKRNDYKNNCISKKQFIEWIKNVSDSRKRRKKNGSTGTDKK